MTAGGPVVATSNKQTVDSVSVPVPTKRRKSREECDEMQKAFTIVTPSAAAAASADDDECRSSGSFISNKLQNYLQRTATQRSTK